MKLKFITGNQNKVNEVRRILGDFVEIEQLELDLPEIQSLDPDKIIEAKLKAAAEIATGPFIVEDVSLHFMGMKGFPGPLIKWMEQAIGNDGIYELVKGLVNTDVQNRVTYGYYNETGNIEFFVGIVGGKIVAPRGNKDFGWGPIFQPTGSDKTYGEMDWTEKEKFSPRIIALEKLRGTLQ